MDILTNANYGGIVITSHNQNTKVRIRSRVKDKDDIIHNVYFNC